MSTYFAAKVWHAWSADHSSLMCGPRWGATLADQHYSRTRVSYGLRLNVVRSLRNRNFLHDRHVYEHPFAVSAFVSCWFAHPRWGVISQVSLLREAIEPRDSVPQRSGSSTHIPSKCKLTETVLRNRNRQSSQRYCRGWVNVTQGALRDPGLWNGTALRYCHRRLVSHEGVLCPFRKPVQPRRRAFPIIDLRLLYLTSYAW
jgi:hypothetical protein